jgi:hypothetical protein
MIRRWVNGSASSAASSAATTATPSAAAHTASVGVRPGGRAAIAIGGDAATGAAGIDALRRLGEHGAAAATTPACGDRRRPLRAAGLCRARGGAAALCAAIGFGADLPAIVGTGGDALTGAGLRVARLRRRPLL